MANVLHSLMVALVRFNVRGWTRIYSLVFSQRFLRAKTRHGLALWLNPFEYIDSHVIRSGYYEAEVLESMLAALQDGQVLWDVGANIGLHSLTCKLLRPDVTVIAFEPNPAMAERIDIGRRANNLDINVVRQALGRQNESARLWLHSGNSGMSSLTNWHGVPIDQSISCTVCTGKSVIDAGVPMPNVVKIDVEGNELAVLEGMGELILSPSLHTIIFEDSTDRESDVKSLLARAGFQICLLQRLENTAHNLENYVATRALV